jgi:hypothetical protein
MGQMFQQRPEHENTELSNRQSGRQEHQSPVIKEGVADTTAGAERTLFNVTFSEPIYEALRSLAHTKGMTIADVLREAIALEKWFEDARQQGWRLLVERDGKVHELVQL